MQTRTLLATVDYDAGDMQYNFPFLYLRKEFVRIMYLHPDGSRTPLVYHDDYDVEGGNIILAVAGDSEDTIRIYRETPTEQIIVDYVDASILKAYDLNIRDIQLLHILEESMDYVNLYALLLDPNDSVWDALGRRLKNLADPEEDGDATNKKYVNDEDEKIMTFIRRFCMLLDEEKDKWEGRGKGIMRIADPDDADDATTKRYVDTKISSLREELMEVINNLREELQNAINALREQLLEAISTLRNELQNAIDAVDEKATQALQTANTALSTAAEAKQLAQAALSSGGSGHIDMDELKQQIIDALSTRVAKPQLINVRYESYGGSWNNWNAEINYNYDAMTVSGNQWAEHEGTYTCVFTLKPFYIWEDGTKDPVSIEWTAELPVVETQHLYLTSITHEFPDGRTHEQEMYNLEGNAPVLTFDGSEENDWLLAPKKTYHFSSALPYDLFMAEYLGSNHNENDGPFQTYWSYNDERIYSFEITVGHDYVVVEALDNTMDMGGGDHSSEYIRMRADGDDASSILLEFKAQGFVEKTSAEPPTLQLRSSYDGTEKAYYGQDLVYDVISDSTGEIELSDFGNSMTILDNPDGTKTYYGEEFCEAYMPHFIVDNTARTITVHLTRNGMGSDSGENHGPYPVVFGDDSNKPAEEISLFAPAVRTKADRTHFASSNSYMQFKVGVGAYVLYCEHFDDTAKRGEQAGDRWYTGSTVYANVLNYNCTAQGNSATEMGNYAITATIIKNAKRKPIIPWFDGTTTDTKTFPWRIIKPAPIRTISHNTSKVAYGDKDIIRLSVDEANKNKVLNAPTSIVNSRPDLVRITPWHDFGQTPYASPAGTTYGYVLIAEVIKADEDADVLITFNFDGTSETGEYHDAIQYKVQAGDNIDTKYAGTSSMTFTHKLSNGVLNKTVMKVMHGEFDPNTSLIINVDDLSVCDIQPYRVLHYAEGVWGYTNATLIDHSKDGTSVFYPPEIGTLYHIDLTFTPKKAGSTGYSITIPATEHYPTQVYNGTITISNA